MATTFQSASRLVHVANNDDLLLHIPASVHTLAGFRAWVLSDEFPEKQPVMFLWSKP